MTLPEASRDAEPGSAGTVEAPHILVVDDDEEILHALDIGLRRTGFRVSTRSSGEAALELIDGTRVDLVVCDLGMPGMSGIDLIREIRKRETGAPVPIILMTGTSPGEALVEGLDAGADEFLTKPVRLAELTARIRAHLRSVTTWSEVLQDELAARASIVEALARIGGAAPPGTAAVRALDLVGRRRTPRYVSLYRVAGEERLVALATYTATGGARQGGAAIVPARAQYLLGRLREGAWVEHRPVRLPDEPDQGFWDLGADLVVGAPIFAGDDLVGALFVAVEAGRGSSIQAQRSQLHASAVDYASAISATLGQGLKADRDVADERERFAAILATRAFQTAFQPIVRFSDGVVVGYEALTRFDDGTRPDVRFAEAAAAGCATDFELGVAAAALDRFAAAGVDGFVSINLSPSVVLDGGAAIGSLVERAASPLVIEVTENMPIHDYAEFAAAVGALPGVSLAIDDAGAGYSSMRHLVQLRPRFAKLDMSLVRGIHADPVRAALITGIGHYALLAGIELIAEGVEHEREAAVLRDLGIDLAQGFLFGRPGPLPQPG